MVKLIPGHPVRGIIAHVTQPTQARHLVNTLVPWTQGEHDWFVEAGPLKTTPSLFPLEAYPVLCSLA